MRRPYALAAILSLAPGSLYAQSLSDRFTQLFTFGDCGQPLCLSVNSAVHGLHYIPAVTQGEHNMLAFFTGSIGNSLGNLPFTTAASGTTFRFVDGVPVATAISPGPIFAERSQTLGRGTIVAGVNVNGISMDNIRGVPLNDLSFSFAHQNTQDPALGDPVFERDIIEISTDLSLSLLVTSVFASYGLLDNIDIGVLVPIVRASLSGTSTAQVNAFTQPTPHQFGTAANPSLTASSETDGSAMGIGDIAVRGKVNFYQTEQMGFAAIADVRLPTGDEENFLGSGATSVRALGVLSGQFGNTSPHLNAGMAFRSGELQNNSLLATVGLDHLLSERVALAVDLVTDFEMGDSKLVLPEPVVYTAPSPVATVELTDIPDQKDNLIDASFGAKFSIPPGYRIVSNILFPLSDGGLRAKFLWTFGIERSF
jgi:hypothetical protein